MEILKEFIQYLKFKSDIRKILEKPNIIDCKSSLHYAAECGNEEMMELIAREKPNIDAKNLEELTCIDILCKNGNLKCLKIVFEHYNENSIDLRKSMELAIKNGHAEVVEFLLVKNKINERSKKDNNEDNNRKKTNT